MARGFLVFAGPLSVAADSLLVVTIPWNDHTLVRINDEYDRENASDGVSRFGAYLRQRPTEFRDSWSDEPKPIEDPGEFAWRAWQVATGPVMVPGYVQVRPDLHGVQLHRDENDGALYAEVRVPLLQAQIGGGAKRFPYSWQDWETDRDPWGETDYRSLVEPRETKRASVLASVIVRIPGREWSGLVTPTAYEGRTLLDEARDTLAAVVRNVNVDAAPIVARINE